MRSFRVALNGWTASFRHPQLVTGMQPTLPLPPPSTIYGLVSAAVGHWVNPEECQVAYVFQANGSAQDLETIYQFSNSASAGSTVIIREWLTDWRLWLYFAERTWAEAFESPCFPLTLGRQQELAHVEPVEESVIQEIELTQSPTTLQGTAVHFPSLEASGMVVALPLVMSPELPREALGVRPWLLVREPTRIESPELLHDEELEQGVYFLGGS